MLFVALTSVSWAQKYACVNTDYILKSIPDYTNINGGFGVFSSRINIDSRVSLSNYTIQQLLNWGFRQR